MTVDTYAIVTLISVIFGAGINYARLASIDERLKKMEAKADKIIEIETKVKAMEKILYQ